MTDPSGIGEGLQAWINSERSRLLAELDRLMALESAAAGCGIVPPVGTVVPIELSPGWTWTSSNGSNGSPAAEQAPERVGDDALSSPTDGAPELGLDAPSAPPAREPAEQLDGAKPLTGIVKATINIWLLLCESGEAMNAPAMARQIDCSPAMAYEVLKRHGEDWGLVVSKIPGLRGKVTVYQWPEDSVGEPDYGAMAELICSDGARSRAQIAELLPIDDSEVAKLIHRLLQENRLIVAKGLTATSEMLYSAREPELMQPKPRVEVRAVAMLTALTDCRRRLLEEIQRTPGMTAERLAARFPQWDIDTITTALATLRDQGKIMQAELGYAPAMVLD